LPQKHKLLIPIYKIVKEKNQHKLKKLKIHHEDFALFNDVMNSMDKRVMALNYNLNYNDVSLLINKQQVPGDFKVTEEERIGKPEHIIKYILNYFKIVPEELEKFSILEDEIFHYRHIIVRTSATGSVSSIEFKRLDELLKKIVKAQNPINLELEKEKLKKLYKNDLDTLMEKVSELTLNTSSGTETFSHRNEDIEIKKLLNHFYFPSIISKNERIKWMKHIIDVPSEVQFIKSLETHLKEKDNYFVNFDWWMFSKIDHSLDKKIRIPYIDPTNGKRDFLPDFIFWLQKGNNYFIVYIDPKGTGRNEYKYKVDGYRDIFEEMGEVKTFIDKNRKIKVYLRLATEDTSVLTEKDFYKKYWIEPENISSIFNFNNK
jgi:hypothetical protein